MKKYIISFVVLCSVFTALAQIKMMTVHQKNGQPMMIPVENIDSITFADVTAPAEITVSDITLHSAKITVNPDASLGKYTIGTIKADDFYQYASESEFFAAELEKMKADADEYWMTLEEYLDFILYQSTEGEQTFTREELEPGTAYYAFAYGLDTKGNVTSMLVKEPFETKPLLDVDFGMSVENLTAKTGGVSTNPDNAELYYYLGYVSKDEYINSFHSDDTQLLNSALGQVKASLAMGGVFESIAHKGKSAVNFGGLVPNTEYMAIAFGMEKVGSNSAAANTTLSKLEFATPGFDVVDDCTFNISFENVKAVLMDINVTPTKADTRYYVTIKAKSDVEGKTPAQVADEQIVFEDGFHMDWAGTKQIFTGTRTLNSRQDIGATNLLPETEYTVFVFGVDTKGYRTTEVSTADVTTAKAEPSNMTVTFKNIQPGSETDPDDWFGGKNYFVTFTPSPSVDDEYYYVGIVKKTDYDFAVAFGDDNQFISEVITTVGETIMLNCFMGEPTTPLKAYTDYTGKELEADTDYYVFSFGYMGQATTPLFKELFHTEK